MAEKKPAAKKSAAKTSAAKRPVAKKAAASRVAKPVRETRVAYQPREARAIQRTARQSPYKMRLVIDQIRGQSVNDALALLAFSKKHAAREIAKVLRSAVANAEQAARAVGGGGSLDVDTLVVTRAVVNEGPKLKRFMP